MLWLAFAAATLAPAEEICQATDARVADLSQIAAAPDRWYDRCVRLDGYVYRNRFYTDVGGYYASAASDTEDRRNGGWLGLYPLKRNTPDRLVRASVVGTLSSCRRIWNQAIAGAGPNTIVMLSGYCHSRGGLVLRLASMRVSGRATFDQQFGADARSNFGDLIPVTAEGMVPPIVSVLADRFVSLVRAGDRTELAKLVSLWSELVDDADREAAFHSLIAGEGTSPLAFLRRAGPELQRAYFQERQSGRDQADGYVPTWHICFCRTEDCSERWPIAAIDSLVDAARPYACVRTTMSNEGLSHPPDALAIQTSEGLTSFVSMPE